MPWIAQANPQVHQVWAGTWRTGTVEPLRVLIDHELVVFTRGACVVEVDGERFARPAGTWLIVPPGRAHLTRVAGGPAHRQCVHFDWCWQGGMAAGPAWTLWPDRPPAARLRPAPDWVPAGVLHGDLPAEPDVPALLRTLAQRWSARRGCVRAPLVEVFTALFGAAQAAGTDPDPLASAVRALLDRLDPAATSIQRELATLGFTYAHCCRVFRHRYGISPLRYLTAGRLERAKPLLAEGLPVAEVARRCGFADPRWFARCFRRYAGASPGRFRLPGAG